MACNITFSQWYTTKNWKNKSAVSKDGTSIILLPYVFFRFKIKKSK